NVSTKVTAAQPVIAERSMYYNNRTCAHDSIGTSQPADIWYLAEGATLGGFETWVLVQNPNPTTTQANITFMTDSGQVAGPTLNLKANSRESVNVGDHVQTYNVSTKVTAAQPVIAERSMYYNNRTCAHDSIGTSQPADIWYLAEGCTDGGFETWVLVQNPNDTWTQATLTFMTDSGPVAGPTLGLQANSRRSVNVGDHVQTYNVSTKVTAAQPVIAERSMYWSKPLPPPPPPSFTSDDYPTAPGLTQHYWTGSNLDEDGRLNIEGLPVGGPWLLNNSEDDYSICAYINPADNYAYGNFSGSNMGRVWSGEPNTSQFFYKDSSSMSYLGYAQPEIVGYRTLKFDPPSLSYRFPFSVGDSWGSSSSYQITGLSPGHGSYTRNTNVLAYTRIIHMKREGFSPCFA
ncbi:MAG: hypothetical protein L6433_00960, partial [Actinomycetia bacterium]|nr:hypothetical protein [Actinomycetes bacterium]